MSNSGQLEAVDDDDERGRYDRERYRLLPSRLHFEESIP